MPDHRIRLRGGWECWPVQSPADRERLTLPTRWAPGRDGRLVLYRRFGRPALAIGRETPWLEIEHVPGLYSISLNEKTVTTVTSASSRFEFKLDTLLDRNVLILEIDLTLARSGLDPSTPLWGVVSLIIRRDEVQSLH